MKDLTKTIKMLISQGKGIEKTINQILQSDSAEHSRYSSFKQTAIAYNELAKKSNAIIKADSIGVFNTENMKDPNDTLWGNQKEIIESVLLRTRMLISTLESNIDFVGEEIDNFKNFIKLKLRSIVFKIPDKEKEVQNNIETLLIGKGYSKGIDYDRETGKFNYSGREYIPDFILPKIEMCIEVKLLKDVSKKSRLIEEINADIPAYLKNYNDILFIIYDLGFIRDVLEFSRDIESNDGVHIVIIKH